MAASAKKKTKKENARTPRAIWSGSISFGLVNVPVRLYAAIDEQDLHFHLLHTKDDSRIGYEKFCKKEGKPVPDDEIGKAYELENGTFVYLTDEDFAAAEGAAYKTIDIADFVPHDEIDPIYFERTFFLGPADGAEKVYSLLLKAMEKSGLAAVGKFVMRDKQQLGCLRIHDGALVLEKMYFADEVRTADKIRVKGVRVADRELRMALELIDRFAGSFDITKYRDDYREALLAVIKKKQKGDEVHVERPERRAEPDLMEALRASLAEQRPGSRGQSRAGASNGDLASLSKQALVARARRERVRGYSSMTKDELVAALS